MRMEAFSETYNIPVRKIRYYMDEDLLHPVKEKGYFIFDEPCCDEIRMLLRLKECGFTIREIKEWRKLDREMADLREAGISREVSISRQGIMDKVMQRLEREKASLKQCLVSTGQYLEQLCGADGGTWCKSVGDGSTVSGSAVSMMRLICCPYCGKALNYHDVSISNQELLEGNASCACGYRIRIREGILVVPDRDPGLPVISPLDLHRETYRRMPPQEVSELQVNFNWIIRQLGKMDLRGKVIFENSVDVVSLLSTGIAELCPDASYIIADSDFKVLRDIRERISALGIRREILYIVSPHLLYPIRKHSIDILIDYYTTEVLQRLNIPTLLQEMKPYMREGSGIFGVFTYIKKGYRTSRKNAEVYPGSYKGRYQLKEFQANLQKSGVQELNGFTSNVMSCSGALDTYQEGDVLGEYCFMGKVE